MKKKESAKEKLARLQQENQKLKQKLRELRKQLREHKKQNWLGDWGDLG